MREFLEITTSLPTVIFTVTLLISLGYWLISTALGLGDSGLDGEIDLDADLELDLDAGTDVDGDIEIDGSMDSGSNAGFDFGSFMSMIGLHLMPLSLVFTVTSLVGWLLSIAMTVAIGNLASVGLLIGIAIFFVSLFGGFIVSGRVARVVAPIFRMQRAAGHSELIGRMCVLRTGRVDESFGQAEVVDSEGGSHLIQVRCKEQNTLTAGDQALLVAIDDGVFYVSDDIEILRERS